MEGIEKAFPGVVALDGASLRVAAGEVHAIIGQNGAGKSTLIKILNGAYRRDAGTILLEGRPIDFHDPQEAQLAGVSTIYQEINLVPYRSVAENIFMGREPQRWGLLDRERMNRDAAAVLDRLGVHIDVRRSLGTLNIALQQMVAIARAISTDARIVIMDEPTSSLDDREVEVLFDVIRGLKARGIAVIYISHRLDELYAGSGRTEVARAVFGADPVTGELRVRGKPARWKSPRDAIRAGFGLCSEDRKADGIIPYMSVRENLTLAALPALSRNGIVDRAEQRKIVDRFIDRLGIKTAGPEQTIRELSGGNQQKVLLARWLCLNPSLLVLDEPTRGIDVGAKAEIQGLIDELADNGLGVLMISSELEEITEGADRVVVLREGRTVAEFDHAGVSQDTVMHAMAHGDDESGSREEATDSRSQSVGATPVSPSDASPV